MDDNIELKNALLLSLLLLVLNDKYQIIILYLEGGGICYERRPCGSRERSAN